MNSAPLVASTCSVRDSVSPTDAPTPSRKCTGPRNIQAQLMCDVRVTARRCICISARDGAGRSGAWAAVPCGLGVFRRGALVFSIGSPASPDFCGRRGPNSGTVQRRVELAVLHFIARPRGCICPEKLTELFWCPGSAAAAFVQMPRRVEFASGPSRNCQTRPGDLTSCSRSAPASKISSSAGTPRICPMASENCQARQRHAEFINRARRICQRALENCQA